MDLSFVGSTVSGGYGIGNMNMASGMGTGVRRGTTAVAWSPDNVCITFFNQITWSNINYRSLKILKATQIITASEDDINPVIVMWDVRNAHAPEKV